MSVSTLHVTRIHPDLPRTMPVRRTGSTQQRCHVAGEGIYVSVLTIAQRASRSTVAVPITAVDTMGTPSAMASISTRPWVSVGEAKTKASPRDRSRAGSCGGRGCRRKRTCPAGPASPMRFRRAASGPSPAIRNNNSGKPRPGAHDLQQEADVLFQRQAADRHQHRALRRRCRGPRGSAGRRRRGTRSRSMPVGNTVDGVVMP